MTTLAPYLIGAAAGALTVWAVTPRRVKTQVTKPRVDGDGNWHFPVDTVAQMLAIPKKRRERFLAELPDMLRHMWGLFDAYPLRAGTGAEWVDDGLGEFRPVVKTADGEVGLEFEPTSLASGEGEWTVRGAAQ